MYIHHLYRAYKYKFVLLVPCPTQTISTQPSPQCHLEDGSGVWEACSCACIWHGGLGTHSHPWPCRTQIFHHRLMPCALHHLVGWLRIKIWPYWLHAAATLDLASKIWPTYLELVQILCTQCFFVECFDCCPQASHIVDHKVDSVECRLS